MRASVVCSLAIVAILAVANQARAAIELSSTQAQVDHEGTFSSPLEITENPFEFSDYLQLATIDKLTITLTVVDGDTKETWDRDYDEWTLGLDGVDTLLVLNGFPNSPVAKELPFEQIPVPTQEQILANLKDDGKLVATIIDAVYGDNYIELCYDPGPHYATLTLEGRPVPEPSTMAIWSLLGASVAGLGWRRRRRGVAC